MSPAPAPKPDWIRVKAPSATRFQEVRASVRGQGVRTVCDSSQCPNISDCWGHGTATFMVLGGVCTRSCRFCAVPSGDPGGKVDREEPERVARAARELGLRHVVVTSVARDDLQDGGAGILAMTAQRVHQLCPGARVELLLSDLGGNEAAIRLAASSGAEVLGHNLETVRRLQAQVRDRRAGYERSLDVLEALGRGGQGALVKTSLMLGLGEEREEVLRALRDARQAGAQLLTLGQYLRPAGGALPVARYLRPEEFEELRHEALGMGYRRVWSGPMVRSSYHAHEAFVDRKED